MAKIESLRLVKRKDYWDIELDGWRFEQCVVDYAFGLSISNQVETIQIRLNREFSMTRDNARYDFNPVTHPEQLGPALSLLHLPVQKIRVWKNGYLLIVFPTARLEIQSDQDFEAWELSGPKGMLIVSLPGNEVAIWQ